jgi:hypothetical protein
LEDRQMMAEDTAVQFSNGTLLNPSQRKQFATFR